jgi:branched-chain amino acid transport system substrate-binding protein
MFGSRTVRWLGAVALLGGALLGAQAQPIVVAQVGPFTVLPSPDAREVNEGARAWFAQVNQSGGVRGRPIELFELDDKFNADDFARQFDAAMQRKPVALLTPIGSAALNKLVNDKLLDKHPVVIINAIPGAEPFRKPGHPRLFHVRASDRQQLEKIVQHARTLGAKKLGVLYQELPIGHAGVKVVQELAQAAPALEVPSAVAQHELDLIGIAARKVAAAQTQAVVVIGSPKFMADAVDALRKAGVRQFVFALSYMPAGLVAKVAGAEGARGVAIAQAFPNPNGVALRLQREFQAAMRALQPEAKAFTSFQLEGYVAARVLVEGLRRSSGEIDGDAIARALKGMGTLDLGGFYVSFDKSNEGSGFVDIGVVNAAGRLIY